MQAICKRAAVTAPSLYHHYGNKDGLIAAAVESLAETWLHLLDSSIPRSSDLAAMLASAAHNWEAMVLSPERPLAVFTWVSLLTAPESEEATRALQHSLDVGAALIVERLLPYFEPADAAAIAQLSISSLIGTAVIYHVDGDASQVRGRLAALTESVRSMADAAPRSD